MCDYSLMGLPNRLACQGEELVTRRFSRGSIGFSPPVYGRFRRLLGSQAAEMAVCIMPGAKLQLTGIPASVRQQYNLGEVEDVVFDQLSEQVNSHRDAVTFSSGKKLLIQRLGEGVKATVISLGNATQREPVEENGILIPVGVGAGAYASH